MLTVTWVIMRQVRHQMRNEGSPLWSLGLAVVGGAMAFALADYIIADAYPGQFVGLETKLDGLYFALTTLATVGYGDVHAEGELARGVVSYPVAVQRGGGDHGRLGSGRRAAHQGGQPAQRAVAGSRRRTRATGSPRRPPAA